MKNPVEDIPVRKIKHLQFGALTPQEIANSGSLRVWQTDLYDVNERKQVKGGALDKRLGVSGKDDTCETCGKKLTDCIGHFGHITLALPVFHAGYFKATLQILQQICKCCSKVLLEEKDRREFLKKLRQPGLDNAQKMKLLKQISTLCKKVNDCPYCHSWNGTVKKVGVMKLVHEKYKSKTKDQEEMQRDFKSNFIDALKTYPELKSNLNKAQDDLNPLHVMELFEKVESEDCELLGLNPLHGRPEQYIWTVIPVPPVCIRPSVIMERGDVGSNEDDLTVKLAEIVTMNKFIQKCLDDGDPVYKIVEDWEFLQLICAQYVNSEMPGLAAAVNANKWIRGVCQRLKGKHGRFRGNLSGKRVDFSARTVISPDPNLRIDQVAVPEHVAKIMTYPEVVNEANIEKLRQCVRNGPDVHPGAQYVCKPGQMKRYLKFVNDKGKAARDLKIGDIVERHLDDGDVVLFNRQPSLHKLSIMSHFAKVRPWKTFRFNECVCTPYNADFDGDEMNLHLPQTEEARAEAIELMGVKNNLVTPRNGEPLIAATQDFITGSYLITRKDVFYTKEEFCQIVTFMFDAEEHIDLPPPTIIKPIRLWTGKQVFSILLRPNKKCNVLVNLESKTRSFVKDPSRTPDLCPNDGWLVVKNSEIMCGLVDKSIVGDGNKSSLFYAVLQDFGSVEAAKCMNRLAKLCARWMANRGFSIGIEDVMPGERLWKLRDEVISKGYEVCEGYIKEHKNGTLRCQAGCDMDQTLEAQISGTLSRLRDELGQICLNELDKHNSPLIMSLCGSKGSKINVCQMVACVGQQIISGSRIADGFDDRTLPHFVKSSRIPAAKGFVKNSFFTGLRPPEFFFHAASGREGLVDTAVKTAETGYMQRRLMKALEDLAIKYDYSVRSSSGTCIQFDYGNDRLDPALMEGDDVPVEFNRCLLASQNVVPIADSEKRLRANEILSFTKKVLDSREFSVCSSEFLYQLFEFVEKIAKKLVDYEKKYGDMYGKFFPLSEAQLRRFLDSCRQKYHKAKIEPGTACGALGAQSIGEPGTQMTLKTFHFAGVASMNVTMGVPRIKEIINAAKNINTPIISACLVNDDSETAARIVKARIETTTLGEISEYIEERIDNEACYLIVKIDKETVLALQLEIDMTKIIDAIVRIPKLKIPRENVQSINDEVIKIRVFSREDDNVYFAMQQWKRSIAKTVIKGISTIQRAVINEQEGKSGHYELLAEGYGLKEVMSTDGVIGTETTSNHIMEVEQVLGIEAARTTIINQIQYTMSKHGMTIDRRHVMLLADTMTFKGEVLGITRFGVAKMKDSVLMLASFEKTTDHLFDAALYGKKDEINGVSECIIMGIPMPIGTGQFDLLYDVESVQNDVLATMCEKTPCLLDDVLEAD